MKKEDFFELLGDVDDDIIKLAAEPMKKQSYRKVCGALAACAALAIAAVPAYRLLQPADKAYHSYVSSHGSGANVDDHAEYSTILTDGGLQESAGAGNTPESSVAELTAPNTEDLPIDSASDPNTGDLPADSASDPNAGDLPIGSADAAAQEEAIMAYQNLMARFAADYGADNYPDWYGGSYISDQNILVVNTTSIAAETYGKEFYLEIMEWASCENIMFGEVTYSLNFLRSLQKELEALPELETLSFWGCGVNEQTGQLELSVPYADEALLRALADLDPADDAILVQVVDSIGYFE